MDPHTKAREPCPRALSLAARQRCVESPARAMTDERGSVLGAQTLIGLQTKLQLVVFVGHTQDTGRHGDLVADEAVRIAAAVIVSSTS
jgi:hypothetical protein